MTENIYTYALEILKNRENYWGEEAHKDGHSYSVTCACLDRAGAYNSAWWILWYAIHEQWDALEQFDYTNNLKGEI